MFKTYLVTFTYQTGSKTQIRTRKFHTSIGWMEDLSPKLQAHLDDAYGIVHIIHIEQESSFSTPI